MYNGNRERITTFVAQDLSTISIKRSCKTYSISVIPGRDSAKIIPWPSDGTWPTGWQTLPYVLDINATWKCPPSLPAGTPKRGYMTGEFPPALS